MPRRSAFLIALTLIAAACSGGDGSDEVRLEDLLPPPSSETTSAVPASTAASAPPDRTEGTTELNRLVILDGLGNVVTLDPDGSDRTIIADAGAEGASFFQPIWSPVAHQLAWSATSGTGGSLEISAADGSGRRGAPMVSAPFYFYWSPDERAIAALHNGAAGVELEVVNTGRAVTIIHAGGTPFYFTWSPDGDDLAAHVGAGNFVRVGMDGSTADLGGTSPTYSAPQWLPEGILHVEQNALVITSDGSGTTPLAGLPGPVTFVANPDGSLVALQADNAVTPGAAVGFESLPDVPSNAVYVLDTVTGSISPASEAQSIGFFWSPSGERLLILQPAAELGFVDVIVWENGVATTVGRHAPLISFVRNVLPFFDQYAQSFTLWAPDSESFAFVGSIGEDQGVWVQKLDGSAPVLVSDGSWVSWSHS